MAGLAFAGITGFGGITDTAESARPSLAGQLASFDAAFGGGGGSFWAGSGDGYTHRGSPNSDFGTDGPSGGLLGGESGGGLGGEGFQQPGVGPGGGGSGGDGGSGPGPTGESDPPPEFLNSPPIILGNGEPPSLSADGSHAPIPEPTAIAPFGAGLLLLAFGSRRLTSSSEKKR